jgi:hypothetical protein
MDMPAWREDALKGAALGALIFLGLAMLFGGVAYWLWSVYIYLAMARRSTKQQTHSLTVYHIKGRRWKIIRHDRRQP